MEQSILISTKQILNLELYYNNFDLDVLTHINSAFAKLHQLGIGPEAGFEVTDDTSVWADYGVTDLNQLGLIKTYVHLIARILFDPPKTSFDIKAKEDQIREYEWRLQASREVSFTDED